MRSAAVERHPHSFFSLRGTACKADSSPGAEYNTVPKGRVCRQLQDKNCTKEARSTRNRASHLLFQHGTNASTKIWTFFVSQSIRVKSELLFARATLAMNNGWRVCYIRRKDKVFVSIYNEFFNGPIKVRADNIVS